MKILVLGSGARESALLWKLKKDSPESELFCLPGNGGTASLATNVNIDIMDNEAILGFAQTNNIDITLVGPEAPLVNGVCDEFRAHDLCIIGPDKKAAQLEGSKAFAKKFMQKYGIPTADYNVFSNYDDATKALKWVNYPLVIKADGLAGGKGVLIVQNHSEAMDALNQLFIEKQFGEAGENVVFEEFLQGVECSLICLVDGQSIVPLESARDYKRAYDFDNGPNTGGMGCFSPNPLLFDEDINNEIYTNILKPFLYGIKKENMDFRGIAFLGLMLTENGVKLLEFNVRFGDPETEVLMPRLNSSLIEIMQAIHNKNLNELKLNWLSDVAVCVVLASKGYPGDISKNDEISINSMPNNSIVYCGGAMLENNKLITSGGRVLVVANTGKTLVDAREKVYQDIQHINYDGMWYRVDIGLLN